jgi:PAS domain S-box-containing protein
MQHQEPTERDAFATPRGQNVIMGTIDMDTPGYGNTIVETMREPLLLLDARLRVSFANRSFYQLFKASPGQVTGRLVYELGDGQWDIPALRKLLDQLLTTDSHFEDYQVEHDFPDIGRRTMLLNARPLHAGDEKTRLILLVIEDSTERRAAEHRLEVSEVRYRRLFEAAHDGILILNTGTRTIVDVNPFIVTLLDYPREHFIGKELSEIGIFRDKATNQTAMQELHEKGFIRFEDLPLQDRHGQHHAVEIVANVYQEGPESVIQCNIRDISERVRFERERAAMLANEHASRVEAEAANRSKDLFLAMISHELRAPLSAILGWAQLLRSEKLGTAQSLEAADAIERSGRAQAALINDLLDASRLVAGKMEVNTRPLDLSSVVGAAIQAAQSDAKEKQIRLEQSIESSLPPILGDPIRLQQVASNLLSNAIKFTPPGGRVDVVLRAAGPWVEFVVRDTGAGMSADFIPRVFDRFEQEQNPSAGHQVGLGLGLPIVRSLVELHGGAVKAKSAGKGRGANFTVRLPVAAILPPPSDQPTSESHDLTGLRIHLVDDDSLGRGMIATLLRSNGATVTESGSAADALKLIGPAPPDVLISYIGMLRENGYSLIREVRRLDAARGHQTPAVALTAYTGPQDRRLVLAAGFTTHAPKPVDPAEFVEVIAHLAGRA